MAMDEEFDGNSKEIDDSKWTVWWELIKSSIGLDEDYAGNLWWVGWKWI